ncbi:MAG: DUF2269 domain-containing protein [Candidatus Thiodiazotropha sp. (ex Dulcina madagascariensis)]|nr:DUF2269 domain-containing protein [Candidatus Thiodiazotropha sp. (ex Dulcina madagascariensis)]MCU7925217.1 DUF2269 domain-containing protein [Candidatus Thiodiazotropha sp. (ex Dulcina madagascariensis)]
MNEYLLIKWIHILSATFLFGTGLGSAFYKWLTDRGGDPAAMAQTNRIVVIADWIFTSPTIIIQPITGLWLLQLLGIPLTQGWVMLTIVLYILAGICWLPVVWLQIRMRDLSTSANTEKISIDPRYHSYARIWFWLGIPAFVAMVIVYFVMVFKPVIGI